jgi:two-component system nitrate/nitrite response regulator NarL
MRQPDTARRGALGVGMLPSDRCGTPVSAETPSKPISAAGESLDGHGIHPVRVLLVADVSVHRDGLVDQLDREAQISVVGATSDLDESIRTAWNVGPDIVLLDIAAEKRVPTIAALVEAIPDVRIVAFAVEERERDIIACAEAGVAACITHEASFPELVAAIERVGLGESLCSPRVVAVLLRRVAKLAAERTDEAARTLTPREQEIVELIDEGLSNKQIAQRLFIQVPTVKNHVHNVLEKLHVHRRYEAAARMRARRLAGSSGAR